MQIHFFCKILWTFIFLKKEMLVKYPIQIRLRESLTFGGPEPNIRLKLFIIPCIIFFKNIISKINPRNWNKENLSKVILNHLLYLRLKNITYMWVSWTDDIFLIGLLNQVIYESIEYLVCLKPFFSTVYFTQILRLNLPNFKST